jgi:hypothetical protein
MSGERVRRLVVLLFAAFVSTRMVGCGDQSDDIDFTARAGEACRDCDECCTGLDCCLCRTCTVLAYDEGARVVLHCAAGTWVVHKECPGGVSVECDGGFNRETCLNENGEKI